LSWFLLDRAITMFVLRRLALPLALVALIAGSALGASSANQARGRQNRAAILKNKTAKGDKGRVRTQFVRDTGKSSLVKVMKLDSKGKATGQVEAFLVNKQTGVARKTSASALKNKTTRKAIRKPAKKASKKTTPKKSKGTLVASTSAAIAGPAPEAAEVAAPETPEVSAPEITTAAAPDTSAAPRPVVTPLVEASATGVVAPIRSAARSAVMRDPMVANSPSVAAIDPEAITPAEAKAMALVEQRLKVTSRSVYDVVPTFEQSRGDKTNPVTGSGMIELVAVQKVKGKQNFIKRFFHAFSPRAQRRVELVLDDAGQPAYMVDRPDSLPYRIARRVVENVPIREFVNDVVRSDGVRKGGVMGILAGGLAVVTGPVGWGVAGVVAPMAWKSAVEGIRQRQLARQTALTEAVTEIKKSLTDGKTVTIEEAYETYKAKLSSIKEGTTVNAPSTPASPISRRDFVKAISAPPHNL
jgi:hypothetical protein